MYLELSRTSTMELFCNFFFFFCNIYEKAPVPESLFNKLTGLYSATSLKDRTPSQMLSDGFCEILKTRFFYRTLPHDCFCSTEKYFTNKIVKNPLRKEKKWKLLVKKPTTHTVLLLFKNCFISLFSTSHHILKTRMFRNNAIPSHSKNAIVYCRKLFLTFGLKKIVFYLCDCNSNI